MAIEKPQLRKETDSGYLTTVTTIVLSISSIVGAEEVYLRIVRTLVYVYSSESFTMRLKCEMCNYHPIS